MNFLNTIPAQTFGNHFESDGILRGDLDVKTVQCDPNAGCAITVPAPGFALVFFDDAGFSLEGLPAVVSRLTTYSPSPRAALSHPDSV